MPEHFLTRIFRATMIVLTMASSTTLMAQDMETYQASQTFQALLRKNDFAELERIHTQYVSTARRSKSGTFLADTQADFSDLTDCNKTYSQRVNGGPPVEKKALPPATCAALQNSRLGEWSKKFPSSVLPHIARSEIFRDKAWVINPRLPADAAERDRQLDQALLALDAAPQKIREPVWYIYRMRIATLQGWGSKQFWPLVTEAASRYPNHDAIYRQAVTHFLPEKGGSIEDIAQLAQLAVSKSLHLEGSSMYAHVYDEFILGNEGLGASGFHKTGMSWPTMKLGLDDIYRRFPDASNRDKFAWYACLAYDGPALRKLMTTIKDKDASDPTRPWHEGLSAHCRKIAENN